MQKNNIVRTKKKSGDTAALDIDAKRNKSIDICKDLFETLTEIEDTDTMARFMKDLCTPQEIKTFAERWHVCKILYQGELSYREINEHTGASLATITRVARFLKDEEHHGYRKVLDKQQASHIKSKNKVK